MSTSIEPAGTLSPAAGRLRLRQRLSTLARPALACALGLGEILITSLLFSFEVDVPYWQHPAYWVRHVVMLAMVAGVAWTVIVWPRRQEVSLLWAEYGRRGGWLLPLALNLALFAVLVVASVAFTAHAAQAPAPPWGLFWLYCVPLAATALSIAWLAASPSFWLELLRRQGRALALALGAGVALLVLGGIAQTGWELLAGVTLTLVHGLLSLYESDVRVDPAQRLLAVRDFAVIIDQSCSGYEGMALVTAFLSLYLWVFRATLRFPHALALIPIGIAAIFVLNIVRIAALVGIGAHLSPDIAAEGFHSQAGWMAFLAVTIGLMLLVPRISWLARTGPAAAAPVARSAAQDDRVLLAYLVPFMGLMAGSIIAAASAPYDTWMYGIKIALAGIALLVFLDVYRTLLAPTSALAVTVGIAVGAVWIATDPGTAKPDVELGAWLSAQPALLAALWLAIRAFGSVIVVPIVEELAFRGLLYRMVVSRRFEEVAFSRLSWLALAVSSALFGLLHSRPLAGALAGAVFALLMVRSGRLMDAIVAHIAANAVIIAWAVGMRQWTLL